MMKMKIKQGLADVCGVWATEMRNTFRDEGVLIFFILVPLFYPLLYSWIYTNEVVREVPVAVVDMSHSDMSRSFIRQFDASPDVSVALYCNNLDEAKDAIGRQQAFGVLYFPTDFQNRVVRMEQSRVSVFCDMSFMLYYKAIFQTATAVAGEMNAGIQVERAGNWTDREDEITTKPLDFDEVQIFNSTGGYGNFIIPGVLMLIIQQTLLLGVGLSMGTARERLRRLVKGCGCGGISRSRFRHGSASRRPSRRHPDACRSAGARTVLFHDLRRGDGLHHARRAAHVRFHVAVAARRHAAVHASFRAGVHIFLYGHVVFHPLQGEYNPRSGVHFGAVPVHVGRVLAAERNTRGVAMVCLAVPFDVWHTRFCAHEYDGRAPCRCQDGIRSPVDTSVCVFRCHVPALPLAAEYVV